MDFNPSTEDDKREMLDRIGADSLEDLFSDIPEELKVENDLIDEERSTELELKDELQEIADDNEKPGDRLTLVGAGLYDHLFPL